MFCFDFITGVQGMLQNIFLVTWKLNVMDFIFEIISRNLFFSENTLILGLRTIYFWVSLKKILKFESMPCERFLNIEEDDRLQFLKFHNAKCEQMQIIIEWKNACFNKTIKIQMGLKLHILFFYKIKMEHVVKSV